MASRSVSDPVGEKALSRMTDHEVKATLTEVPGNRAVDRAWFCSWPSIDLTCFLG
jgi:hypothetical protein